MSVDEADLVLQLAVLSPAHHGLGTSEDDVELPIGVAPFGWWWQVVLVPIAIVIVLPAVVAATSIVTMVVAVIVPT